MLITKEGIPFILVPLSFSFISFILSLTLLGIFFLLISLFMAFFFRDPKRKIPSRENILLSPADGKIIEMKEVEDEILPGKKFFKISIFMSPLNVHIVRAPLDGKVRKIIYKPGHFKPAYKEDSSKNEQNIIIIDSKKSEIMIKQIAGILARRVICRLKENQVIKAGEKIGMIIFGSRVEIFIPLETKILTSIGEKVKGGETLIGEIND
jgi:phosphatidylserine decarboxylase